MFIKFEIQPRVINHDTIDTFYVVIYMCEFTVLWSVWPSRFPPGSYIMFVSLARMRSVN